MGKGVGGGCVGKDVGLGGGRGDAKAMGGASVQGAGTTTVEDPSSPFSGAVSGAGTKDEGGPSGAGTTIVDDPSVQASSSSSSP